MLTAPASESIWSRVSTYAGKLGEAPGLTPCLRSDLPTRGARPMTRRVCDLTGAELAEGEASTLRLSGPIAAMAGRTEIDLGKAPAAALVRWLGIDLHRPELEAVAGPGEGPRA